MTATTVGKLVFVIDAELAKHTSVGFSVPDDIAEWLVGVDHCLWRLFAMLACVPDSELTDELISAVVDVYIRRGMRLRKAVRDAYEGQLADNEDAYEARIREVG